MSEEEKSKKEPDKNKLVLKLGEDDSALVVRTNGEIELISRDLQGKEDNYLGDLEDLNRTFTLVLAFAAALENENLYQHIFHNLNNVLHRQWKKLPPDEKARIKDIRLDHLLNDENRKRDDINQEWMNRWRDEIDKGRQSLEDYMSQHPDERDVGSPFGPEMGPRRRRKKRNPLAKFKDIEWNAYDETLKTHKGHWRLDTPPDEEDE